MEQREKRKKKRKKEKKTHTTTWKCQHRKLTMETKTDSYPAATSAGTDELATFQSAEPVAANHWAYKTSFPEVKALGGAGIAQWLEHRTRDWKVAGSNPCWNGGRIFFSRVDFLCWLLFRYPFHPRVTTVARKISRPFCQKCRWQVTAKLAYTLRMWLLLNRASALVTTCP